MAPSKIDLKSVFCAPRFSHLSLVRLIAISCLCLAFPHFSMAMNQCESLFSPAAKLSRPESASRINTEMKYKAPPLNVLRSIQLPPGARLTFRTSLKLSPQIGRSQEMAWSHLVRLTRNWIDKFRFFEAGALSSSKYYTGGRWKLEGSGSSKKTPAILQTMSAVGNGITSRPQFWGLELTHADPKEQGRWWLTRIGITNDFQDGSILFYMDTSNFPSHSHLGPRPQISLVADANILSTIRRDFQVLDDLNEDLKWSPTPIYPGNGNLLRDRIFDPNRNRMIVLISADRVNNEYGLDPSEFAEQTYGNAEVYYLAGTTADQNRTVVELKNLIGERYITWDGGIRLIQQPRVSSTSGASNSLGPMHMKTGFFPHFYIANKEPGQILNELREVVFANAPYFRGSDGSLQVHTIGEINDINKFNLFSQRFNKQNSQEASSASNEKSLDSNEAIELYEILETLQDENSALEKSMGTLKEDNELLQMEVETHQEEIRNLKIQLNSLLSNKFDDLEELNLEDLNTKEVLSKETSNAKTALIDILNSAANKYGERIVISESAYGTKLKKLRSFMLQPNSSKIIMQAFESLSTIIYPIFFEEGLHGKPEIEKAYRSRLGDEFKGLDLGLGDGPMTRKNRSMTREREVMNNGNRINVAMHIKYGNVRGNMFRLHFGIDRVEKKIVVGYLTDHLEVFSSQNIH